ncbi:MAG: flagellar basal body P-ring protein FlgI [Alphaproteobacteria bacterium]|nr:flagellar basal body P-ring protein FlgI [Alphaproteobacteria bacterium]
MSFLNSKIRHEIPHRRALRMLAAAASVVLATWLAPAGPADAQSRIKDIVNIEGVRDNLLVGYGLVVGLNGTGDTLQSAPFTQQSLIGMLERLGVNTRDDIANLNTANVAAVMVTATLPAFTRQGSRLDVTVSALGDSTSLRGGTLLVTPMLGADGEVYSVAQGPLVVEGFAIQGNAQTIVKGVPTTARIPNGSIVEREIGFALAELDRVHLNLRNPDFTTSQRIVQTINADLGENIARVLDPATIRLEVPTAFAGNTVGLLTRIEQLTVRPDQTARVVIAEHSGVIVMGQDVRISTVAIAQGNLTIRITETQQVSQPNAFATQGQTQVVDRTNIDIDEDEDKRLAVLVPGITLQELVNGLNALGIGPRDMISILQTIKAAGALQAEIEVI